MQRQECRSLTINVQIGEDLIFKLLSTTTIRYQASKKRKLDIKHRNINLFLKRKLGIYFWKESLYKA